jgi:hypothetical protein
MHLSAPDVELFYKLHGALLVFVNQRLNVTADVARPPSGLAPLSPQASLEIRNALAKRLDLIPEFVRENPAQLSSAELDIVAAWQHLVAGKFWIFRELQKHMVFLSSGKPNIAYGVVALSQSFASLLRQPLPVLTETALLPFKGVIVYDGLMAGHNITFGGGIKRMLNEEFKDAKARHGIVTSLPMFDRAATPKTPAKPKAAPAPPTKAAAEEALRDIVAALDHFCKEHLNEEYAVLCRKLAEKLARMRPSPLLHGHANVWASGIARTIGGVNFLHDRSQSPYMRATDIDAAFGIGASTGAAKSAEIRKLLRIKPFDHHWMLPSKMADNSIIWMVQVNGWPVDIRQAPRALQEAAFKKGLIPYIPADRQLPARV